MDFPAISNTSHPFWGTAIYGNPHIDQNRFPIRRSFSVRCVRKDEEEPEFVKDEDGGYLDQHRPRALSTASRLGSRLNLALRSTMIYLHYRGAAGDTLRYVAICCDIIHHVDRYRMI